jgi:hypothetical protein
LIASNTTKSPSVDKALLFIVASFLTGIAAYACLYSLGRADRTHGADVAVALLTLSYFGLIRSDLVELSGWLFLGFGTFCAIVLAVSVYVFSGRFAVIAVVVSWSIAAMVAGPLLLFIVSPLVARGATSEDRSLVLLFVDGYAGSQTLQSWGSNQFETFSDDLVRLGFNVVDNARSSYSMTYASLASALEMQYLVDAGDKADANLRGRLYPVTQGSNETVRILKGMGYRYVHVESGWGGTRCGDQVDFCASASMLDETMWGLLERTALAGVLEESFGHPFTVGSRATFAHLSQIELDQAEPIFVFAHALIPHPPSFLDRECKLNTSDDGRGENIWNTYMGSSTRDERIEAYLNQLACTNKLITSLVARPSLDSAVVAILGDHGTDSRSQLTTPAASWDPEQISERLNTFIAVRGCDDAPPREVVNIMTFLLSCVTGDPFEPLPYRAFVVPVEENFPGASVIPVETSAGFDHG